MAGCRRDLVLDSEMRFVLCVGVGSLLNFWIMEI